MIKRTFRLKWPLFAILFWLLTWFIYYIVLGFNVSQGIALVTTISLGAILSSIEKNGWRRVFLNLGFLVSWVLTTPVAAGELVPSWVWLIPLAALVVTYPVQSWADAPFFPTPHKALIGLAKKISLSENAKILDAGCGLGHGLRELHKEYPSSQFEGIERSVLLTKICSLWCPWAKIRNGDIWDADWSIYDMVYIFQRPESMKRTLQKVNAELKPKSWLVSLEFELIEIIPTDKLSFSNGKMVWLYQMPLQLKSPGDVYV
jgi:hypothetical protein